MKLITSHSQKERVPQDTRVGRHTEDFEDIQLLQAELDAVYNWAGSNFNIGSEIEEKVHVKDLGVKLGSDATFSGHIGEKVASVKTKIEWVLQTFRTRERQPMLVLWMQLILCDLDYCSQLWNASKTGNIQALELLQRSYLLCINGTQGLNYWEQLGELKLYSLECCRERYIAIYIWRILEGHVPNFDMTPVSFQWHPRHGREYLIPRVSGTASSSIQRVRYCSLPIKVLPRSVRNITGCNVETFKARLDRYLTLVPDKPLIPGYTHYRGRSSNSLLERLRGSVL